MPATGPFTLMPTGADIFQSGADAIVSPVDCSGVQGAGLALAIRRRYPEAAARYKALCQRQRMTPGSIWSYRRQGGQGIIFFATKDHWRNPSRLEWIERGLCHVRDATLLVKIRSVAIPALGCGLGGLSWRDVGPLIEREMAPLAEVGVRVMVYAPREGVSR